MATDISIFQLILSGMLVGIVESCPMGPIGVLCVQRTMKKGRKFGLATGAGAAVSDILYAVITGLGLTFVMDFIQTERNILILKSIASLILLAFGLRIFFTDPKKCMNTNPDKNGSVFYNALTGFLLALTNPLIIMVFLALYSTFSFAPGKDIAFQGIGYASIYLGAILWWCILTFIVQRMKQNFGERGINIFNKSIGSVVMTLACVNAIALFF